MSVSLFCYALRYLMVDAIFFFFNDTATTEIYTLSLHDALPIWLVRQATAGSSIVGVGTASCVARSVSASCSGGRAVPLGTSDRKSTRLNSSHANISYAVFCLKKKKNSTSQTLTSELD